MSPCATVDRPLAAPGAEDPLSAALACVRWNVVGYRWVREPGGTGLHHDGDRGHFLLVQSGRVQVSATALGVDSPRTLESGNYLFLPRGGTYDALVLADAVLHTGDIDGDSADAVRLLQAMPPAVLASCLLARDPFVVHALEQMVRESDGDRPGSSSVVAALANVVTTAALRVWAESGCGSADVLRTYLDADPERSVVTRALAAIHSDPGAAWTVERMARVAYVSRSAFAERFRDVVGDSPLRYVAKFRMEEAKRLLRQQEGNVTEVALRLGYSSDAAFIRAFRRHTGEAPGQWRQRGPSRSEVLSTVPPTIAATAPTA